MHKISITVSLFLLFTTGTLLSKERPELDSKMSKLYNSLLNLQILASSPENFKSATNQEAIKKDLEVISNLKHAFPAKTKSEEPGMMAVLSLFNDYVKDAKQEFQKGNSEYARHRVKTMGAFCLSCHTRVSTPGNFEDMERRINKLSLEDFEKAELYAATRQFDKAIGSFRIYLEKKPKSEMDAIHFTRSLRNYVRLLVRVKQEPEAIEKTLTRLLKRKDIPEFDKRMIRAWLEDVTFWEKDKIMIEDLTPEALLRKAQSLIERASSLQAYPADENGDISYLRASGYLHEILEKDPTTKQRGEALYLLGTTYGFLQEPLLWNLDNLLFVQCIREFPHSELSQKCFKKYAWTTYFGFTGSGGTFIPEDELKKFKELRLLSEPK